MANVSEYEFRQQHQSWWKGLGDGGQTLVELMLLGDRQDAIVRVSLRVDRQAADRLS
ncbi:hypothetical protein [Synechococcus sp. PCC 7336]|uniref:hypothetical protein n=1 Tax=Synechococcus sp. PCC 7336 TaxID=195250 RepID=UPI000349B0E5|nr:hypothetical protein [Synechococcus sp. PCC 7336]